MSINLINNRNQIQSGGIISASHMRDVYDVLISGSNVDNIFKDGLNISKMAVGYNVSASGQYSYACGNQGDSFHPYGFTQGGGDGTQVTKIVQCGGGLDGSGYYSLYHNEDLVYSNFSGMIHIKTIGEIGEKIS